MEFRPVFSYLGTLLEIMGILLIMPLFVSILAGEGISFLFIAAAIASFAAGTALDRRFRKGKLDGSSVMVLALAGLVSFSIIGMVPYLSVTGPVNALFESVSGFTTTGLTVLDPEALPAGLLFWRGFTQWIGAAGIIMFFFLLVDSQGISSNYLYGDEVGEEEKAPLIRKALAAFGLYTVLGIVLLSLAGMPPLDAVAHSFSGISTGGFSTREGSIGAFNSQAVNLVMIILMVLGGTSFFLHTKIFSGNPKSYLKDYEARVFWGMVVVFSILLVSASFTGWGGNMLSAVFTTVSALTTSGFYTASPAPGFASLLIIILVIIGGFSASASGGLKIVRVGAMGKAFPWIARKLSYPREAVIPLKLGGKAVKPQEFTIITLFIFVYIMMLVASTAVLSFLGISIADSFFVSASAASNAAFSPIGLGAMHWAGKAVLMAVMVVGRLEVLPLFVFIRHLLQARKREEGGDEYHPRKG
ncbi:MAG: TrkH family potassium uptake protein [Candidatus Aenigmarchaeota archaeon]|nr:TrkH family potassium uptake protein [Candidatus Aenigmarchaeota archaeon]